MTITHKIHMDLVRRGIVPRLQAVQGDALTRQVEISLLADGRPWPIPGAPTVLVRYRRPDRATGEYDTLADGTPAGTTEGTTVTVTLAREVLAVPGDVVLVVTLVAGGKELSTFDFLIAVQPNHSRDIFQGSNPASVTGMLPAPDQAKPGQILVVEDVDEYGKIRKTRTEDAPAIDPPDWSAAEGEPGHVKNRTHYSEFSRVIFPEAEVTWDALTDYHGIMTLAEAPAADQTYKVEYNGEAFILDSVNYDSTGILLGNRFLLDGTAENTGEPFAIVCSGSTATLFPADSALAESQPGSAAVKILAEVIQPLPVKFLPSNSYIIRDITLGSESWTINESYDNFAELLYRGGTIYLGINTATGFIMYLVCIATYIRNSFVLQFYVNGEAKFAQASIGTWKPPAR